MLIHRPRYSCREFPLFCPSLPYLKYLKIRSTMSPEELSGLHGDVEDGGAESKAALAQLQISEDDRDFTAWERGLAPLAGLRIYYKAAA